jgi:hypothetical protein
VFKIDCGTRALPLCVKDFDFCSSMSNGDANERLKAAQQHLQKLNTGWEMVRAMRLVGAEARYFSPVEIQELTKILEDSADKAPEAVLALARAAAEWVPRDHRGLGFWDYTAIACFRTHCPVDALLVWQNAINAMPPSEAPAPAPPATEEKETVVTVKTIGGELPLRPRARKRGSEPKVVATTSKADVVNTWIKAETASLVHIRENMRFAYNSHALRVPTAKTEELSPMDKLFNVIRMTRWYANNVPAQYHIFNPSIIQHPTEPGQFLVNLRCGNYSMTPQHTYVFPPGHSGVSTKNMLVSVPTDFQSDKISGAMLLKAPVMPHPNPSITGLEDIRLIWEPVSQTLYASLTSLEMTEERRPQVCLVTIDLKKHKAENPVRLYGYESNQTQKNWAGFAHEGRLYFVYSFNPVVVLQAIPKTGECRMVSVNASCAVNSWRGSSPLVDLPESLIPLLPGALAGGRRKEESGVRYFMALVHNSNFPKYHNTFIVLKLTPTTRSDFRPFDLTVTHQTPPFVFIEHAVEFSCGFAFTPDATQIVLPFSKKDEFCYCARLTTDSVFKTLQPIPQIQDFQLIR